MKTVAFDPNTLVRKRKEDGPVKPGLVKLVYERVHHGRINVFKLKHPRARRVHASCPGLLYIFPL